MAKTPKDSPTKAGDRIEMRGRPGKGVVGAVLCRAGWMETLWDDGSNHPMICHQHELRKID